MKKVSLLVGSLFLAGMTMAQSQFTTGAVPVQDSEAAAELTDVNPPAAKRNIKVSSGNLAAPGQAIISEDFANGFPSTWTMSPATGGWAYSTSGSQGQYNGTRGAIASTTGANGFMIFDADGLNTPTPPAGFTNKDGYFEIPVGSMSNVGSAVLSFEHFWRGFSGYEVLVLLSGNGGSSWDTIRVDHGVPVNQASDSYFGYANNGAHVENLNVTKYVANKSNVKIRFMWTGTSHYFWMVDDIKLLEGEYNDIAMISSNASSYDSSSAPHFDPYWSMLPVRQAPNFTYTGAAKYENAGSVAQSNVKVNVMGVGPNGYSTSGSSSARLLAKGAEDSNSVAVANAFTFNGGKGDYSINLYPTSDSVLKNNFDDTLSYEVEVSDTSMERLSAHPSVGSNRRYYDPGTITKWRMASLMHLAVADTPTSVSYWMDGLNARRSNKNGTIQFSIYRQGPISGDTLAWNVQGPIFTSKVRKIPSLNPSSSGGWVSLGLDRVDGLSGDTLSPGNYMVVVEADQFFGTDTVFMGYIPDAGYQWHNFIQLEQSTGWSSWFLTNNQYYLRLNFEESFCPIFNGTVASTDATGCGTATGSATVTDPTNGKAPYTYAWSDGQSTKVASNLSSGNYTVTISDANSCTQVLSAAVADAGAPQIANETTTDATCYGEAKGEICFNITGGTAPLTFTWTNTETGDTVMVAGDVTQADSCLKGVNAGEYTVVFTDGSNPPCTQTKTFKVDGAAAMLSASVASEDAKCNGDSNGEATLTGTGGNGGYTYKWSDASSDSARTDLAQGSYTVTVTDASGCTSTETITISEPAVLAIADAGSGATDTYIDCSPNNDGQIIQATITPETSGGNPGIGTYAWTNGGNPCTSDASGLLKIGKNDPNNEGSGDVGPNQSGNGTYSLEFTDPKGCKATKSFTISCVTISIAEFGTNFEMKLFPNPNNGSFNIKMAGADANTYSFEVKNMLGQVVYSEVADVNGDYFKTVDVTESGVGVYFLTISNGEGTASYKVIVE